MITLEVDPKRIGMLKKTGIYVRASFNGRFGSYDISELTAYSLLKWLRSRGGENPWAENTVGVILGHSEPIIEAKEDKR